MTAEVIPVAAMLAPPANNPTPLPATIADPIVRARKLGQFDRQAILDHVNQAKAEHAAARPAMVEEAERTKAVAAEARAEADRLEAEAWSAKTRVSELDARLEHVRTRAVAVFRQNVPARISEAVTALRKHTDDLLAGRDQATADARGRRVLAVGDCLTKLDALAASGVDGEEVEAAIRGMIAGLDTAEAAVPPPRPNLPAQVHTLRRAIEERRAMVAKREHPDAPVKLAALIEAEGELAHLRADDPDALAKAVAIGAKVGVRVPEPPAPRPEPPRYRYVQSPDDQ